MKVLVLGGSGSMGAGGARFLLEFPQVEKIVLSGRNQKTLLEQVELINSDKVTSVVFDALNRDELIQHAKNYDLVLNTIGPYAKYGVPILDAVIEAGVNYVDCCDDHDATAGLLALDEKAKAKGVTALICMGTTPGISNIQAKMAHALLDDVDSLKICWAVGDIPADLAKGTPLEAMVGADLRQFISAATWEHLIHVCRGKIPIWKNGQWDEIDSIEHAEWVDFAAPLGRLPAYYIGHAEPTTLPFYLKINDLCACLGALQPGVLEGLRMEARGHKAALFPLNPSKKNLWQAPELWLQRGVWGGQAAIAEGTKEGQRIRYTVRLMMGVADQGAYMFSGQAIGMYMLGTGQIKQKGVLAPEACIEPQAFFASLAHLYSKFGGHQFTPEELILVEKEAL